MPKDDIKKKIEELQAIMHQYRNDLGGLEKTLYEAIREYEAALRQEKLKEIKESLH